MADIEKLPNDDECDALVRVLNRRSRRLRKRLKGSVVTPEYQRAQAFEIQVMRQLFFVRYSNPAEGDTVRDIERGINPDV